MRFLLFVKCCKFLVNVMYGERKYIYKLELEIVYLLNFVERDLVVYKKILRSYLFFIYSFFFNICKY